MSTFAVTGTNYNRNGSWASHTQQNPVYIGTNSSGSYEYVGQFIFPSIIGDNEIKKVELTLYRTTDAAVYTRVEKYGCSEDLSDYGSVLSTGQQVEFTGGAGWKTVDVSGIIDLAKGYAGEWALLLGFPDRKNTYFAASGYGSANAPYLTVYYDTSTTLGCCDANGAMWAYKVYHAISDTELQQCNVYKATDAITLEKL